MKTVKKIMLTSAILSLALSSCTVKQEAAKVQKSITVSEEGKVSVENDTAKITFSVVTRNYDVNKAVDENNTKSTKIQEALSQAGILKSDIATARFTINQDANSSPTKVNYGAYNVSNTVSVTVRDVTRTGEIIDLCVKNGANQFSSLTFYASQTEKAKKEAEVLAVKNAEAKANSLASAAGAKIGKAITIQTGYTSFMQESVYAKNSYSAVPVNAGSSTISAEVTVTYELE